MSTIKAYIIDLLCVMSRREIYCVNVANDACQKEARNVKKKSSASKFMLLFDHYSPCSLCSEIKNQTQNVTVSIVHSFIL